MSARVILCAVMGLMAAASSAAMAAPLPVPAAGNLWLAGMPEGTTSSGGNDYAPLNAPARVTGVPIYGGGVYSFQVSGAVAHGTDSFSSHLYGGDGGPDVNGGSDYIVSHDAGAENGIGNVIAPYNALLGVFLDDNQPNGFTALATLNFGAVGYREFVTLSPALRQPFFIGDGLTTAQTVQMFTAPAGATRLYLGMLDRKNWYDNTGSFSVTVSVPEPGSLALLGISVFGLLVRRKTGKRAC